MRLAILVPVLALGRWQKMQGLRYLCHAGIEWKGTERCEGKVLWRKVDSEVESQGLEMEGRVECRLESGAESAEWSGE